eukprot:306933-Rhodomonas_salina.2
MGCPQSKEPASNPQPAAAQNRAAKSENYAAPQTTNKQADPAPAPEEDEEVPAPQAFQVKVLSLVRKEVVGKGSSGNVRKVAPYAFAVRSPAISLTTLTTRLRIRSRGRRLR